MNRLIVFASGAALAGACLGIHLGPLRALWGAVFVPSVVALLTAVMGFALYVLVASQEQAPSARDYLDSAVGALMDIGVFCLGLAPGLLFMTLTTTRPTPFWAMAVLAASGVVALLRFIDRLPTGPSLRATYTGWAGVGLALGFVVLQGVAR